MTRLSRPYQIALLALGLLVVVWFLALRGHTTASTGGAGSSPAASTPAPTAASEAKAAAAPTHVYTGPVPGLTGLTRAIAKAHGAVASSQQNAKQVEAESAEASSAARTSSTSTSGATLAQTAGSTTHARPSKGAVTKHPARGESHTASHAAARATLSKPSTTGAASKTRSSSPNTQASVEAELKQGKIVTILFWNSKAAVDRTVQHELQTVGHALGAKIAVRDANADQVGSFGSITRTIQVDETPTILIVGKGGQTTTLTGLTDVFSIEQAIGEAQEASVK